MTKNNKILGICIFLILVVLTIFYNANVFTNLIEKFSNNTLNTDSDLDITTKPSDSFCKSHVGSSSTLEQSCSNLTTSRCNSVSCCVLLNGSKCVAGKSTGPTYQTDPSGNKINFDYYYYQNKCYGSCPSSTISE